MVIEKITNNKINEIFMPTTILKLIRENVWTESYNIYMC